MSFETGFCVLALDIEGGEDRKRRVEELGDGGMTGKMEKVETLLGLSQYHCRNN